ncbi:MAG: hypothetical protein ACXAEU_14910 [Candidatus Hodarchaeales archaeon]|jgi:hypothetical protein
MPLRKKKEKEKQQPDMKNLYNDFGSELKKTLDDSESKADKTLKAGLEKLSEEHYFLPADIATRLLALKTKVQLPPVLFPPSFFEKPKYRGKKEFFERLANDCIIFGISYQRSFGKHPKESTFPTNFLKNRNWWSCEEDDIFEALKILISHDIITLDKGKLIFEDISFSENVAELIRFATTQPSETSITTIELSMEFPHWSLDYLKSIINKLVEEDIVVKEGTKDEEAIYFKALYR